MVENMKTLIDNLQKYYGVYLLIVAVLFLILWFPNRAVNRYAISTGEGGGISIVDTRTGQTWERTRTTIMDLGTTNKPKWGALERIKRGKPKLELIKNEPEVVVPEGFESGTRKTGDSGAVEKVPYSR
jgi:hypothetical protein